MSEKMHSSTRFYLSKDICRIIHKFINTPYWPYCLDCLTCPHPHLGNRSLIHLILPKEAQFDASILTQKPDIRMAVSIENLLIEIKSEWQKQEPNQPLLDSQSPIDWSSLSNKAEESQKSLAKGNFK